MSAWLAVLISVMVVMGAAGLIADLVDLVAGWFE